MAAGRVVIPRNIRRENLEPVGVGELLTTKVNVNVGTSQNLDSPENEVEKALAAVAAGADAVMDLSTGGDLDLVRRKILDAVRVPVGTVPIYNAAVKKDLTSQGMFNALEKHAKDGVDFVTVHVGVNKNSLERLRPGPANHGRGEPGRLSDHEVHRRDGRGQSLLRGVRLSPGDGQRVRADPDFGRRPAAGLHRGCLGPGQVHGVHHARRAGAAGAGGRSAGHGGRAGARAGG